MSLILNKGYICVDKCVKYEVDMKIANSVFWDDERSVGDEAFRINISRLYSDVRAEVGRSYGCCCCCLPATICYSATASWGVGFTTSVIDYPDPSICLLLLWIYYYRSPYPPLLSLDFPLSESPPPPLSANTTCHASAWDNPPTLLSPVSVPSYQSRVISPQVPLITWEPPVSDATAPSPALPWCFPVPVSAKYSRGMPLKVCKLFCPSDP